MNESSPAESWLPTVGSDAIKVVGRVALWGRIVCHEGGFRAEYAYPLDMSILPSEGADCWAAARSLAEAYGVPVEPA